MWFFGCCVVPSRFRRLSGVGVVVTSMALGEFSGWLAIYSKLSRRGVRGSWERNEQTKCFEVRSRLMGGKSGHANSDRIQMCGRGGDAGSVIVTCRQGCTGSTGGQSPRSQESGRQALQLQVERKTERHGAWKQRKKELRARIEAVEKKGGEGVQEGQCFHCREEEGSDDVWEEFMDVEDEWERRSCVTSKGSHVSQKKYGKPSKSQCSTSCKRLRKGGMISCQSIRKCRKGPKRYKESRTQEKFAERKCCSKRGDAEDRRGKRSQ